MYSVGISRDYSYYVPIVWIISGYNHKCTCILIFTVQHKKRNQSTHMAIWTTDFRTRTYTQQLLYSTGSTLPSASLWICNSLLWFLTPVRVTGRERSGGVVLSELSVITIHGGSSSPVYPSTSALLTWNYTYENINVSYTHLKLLL